jgi:chromate transporter
MPDAVRPTLGYRDVFAIFFKAGLAFGGGLTILGVLQDELVERRRLMSREEFLAIYSLGRIVPSGTSTALAVAYGYRFAGLLGTVIALLALVLPGFASTVLLAAFYGVLRASPYFAYVPVTLLPASLGFIVAAALRLGQDVFRPSLDLLVAVGAFVGAFVLGVNPAILLVLGGVAGVLAFAGPPGSKR